MSTIKHILFLTLLAFIVTACGGSYDYDDPQEEARQHIPEACYYPNSTHPFPCPLCEGMSCQ